MPNDTREGPQLSNLRRCGSQYQPPDGIRLYRCDLPDGHLNPSGLVEHEHRLNPSEHYSWTTAMVVETALERAHELVPAVDDAERFAWDRARVLACWRPDPDELTHCVFTEGHTGLCANHRAEEWCAVHGSWVCAGVEPPHARCVEAGGAP